jgi:hypothetical protein
MISFLSPVAASAMVNPLRLLSVSSNSICASVKRLLLSFGFTILTFYLSSRQDGANVAYFQHGDVHYSQVKVVVDELERMNERPLVIIPQKYTAPKFHTNYAVQELSDRDLEVLNE